MKQVTATIQLNGKSKTVTVMLDDKTYALLKQSGDQALFERYVAEEYEASKIERRETRRHKSLDYLIEKGLEFEDERQDPFEILMQRDKQASVQAALKTLTKRQLFIVSRYVFDRKSFREIGDLLGIHKESVRIEYNKAIKKLQKFFRNWSVKT